MKSWKHLFIFRWKHTTSHNVLINECDCVYLIWNEMSSLFLHKTLIFNVLNALIPIELMLIKTLNNRTWESGEVRNAKYKIRSKQSYCNCARCSHLYIGDGSESICPAPGSRPTLSPSVGLLAVLVGLYIIFDSRQGSRAHCVHAWPLPIGCRPTIAGLIN